ncbi:SusC/RagA family TonB-linked outer membrane protein [Compostibacter hankyongensis]|uniref:SusC/RagA family TonB-linked outer membrane protein n=1 Tax=Compostibacter hankyongensis TaxID=1007089 RepID=A0ABP8G9E0_9BACT
MRFIVNAVAVTLISMTAGINQGICCSSFPAGFTAISATVRTDTSSTDTVQSKTPVDTNHVDPHAFIRNGVLPEKLSIYPFSSFQQALKGKVAGLYIQEPSGEPGSEMGMFIRGMPFPFTQHKDIYDAQPTVIVDGVPLIMDHPFAFNIQQYDFNRIGPATNILAAIDLNNIASITVLKDFADAAVYGPRAANGGVILIKTKAPVIGGRKISFNTYFGFVQRPRIYTTNGRYENSFRQPFYEEYATTDDKLNYPLYLRDSTNNAYYGPSDWTDLYYKNAFVRAASASLSSGTDRANFRFSAGNQQTNNTADNTRLDRYNAMFEINMLPVTWLTISSMISAARLERKRNTTLRDRYAEVQYLPDLSYPLPPNKHYYSQYLKEYDESIDQNLSNVITGYFRLNFKFASDFNFSSNFGFDYNEGLRDIFYPSTLMETVNYVSNYYGYNQRIIFDNTLTFHHSWQQKHDLTLEAGEVFQADANKYNYTYAYKGPNDLIKVNMLHSDPSKTAEYLSSKAFDRALINMFLDKQQHHLLSFYGRLAYRYKERLDFSVLLRADGSSSAQPDNWWSFSPTFSAGWDLKNALLQDKAAVSAFRIHASWGRVARLFTDDRFGEGPQYISDLSFSNNPVKFSYDAFPALSRPYNLGYVGYGLQWPYTDQLDVGLDLGLLDNRLNAVLDLYNKTDHNMLLGVPFAAEYGYNMAYKNGLQVRNRGVDLSLRAMVFPEGHRFQWIPGVNINYNNNTLQALPDGLDELIVGSGTQMLKTGHAIDQYWVLQNQGIYTDDAEVPLNPETHKPMSYRNIPLRKGDPKWVDMNGDYNIDDHDKVLKGHMLPAVSGEFDNDFFYGPFSLNLSFYYALGRRILNQEMSNHMDFANREGKIDMDAVKEITFWQKAGDETKYPRYNPWSTVIPYQPDQDLFLENGSFLKLRNISLQYDLTATKWWHKSSPINKLVVYLTVSNLFTLTPYSGGDPELAGFNGYDTGYGLPIPRTYTLGAKLDL